MTGPFSMDLLENAPAVFRGTNLLAPVGNQWCFTSCPYFRESVREVPLYVHLHI